MRLRPAWGVGDLSFSIHLMLMYTHNPSIRWEGVSSGLQKEWREIQRRATEPLEARREELLQRCSRQQRPDLTLECWPPFVLFAPAEMSSQAELAVSKLTLLCLGFLAALQTTSKKEAASALSWVALAAPVLLDPLQS